MALSPVLRKSLIGAVSAGAIAVGVTLITGTNGNDGLEGVRYKPYHDVVGIWTVCYGHTGNDITPGKTYSPTECMSLLNNDLETTARQIDPYIKVTLPASTHGALYSFAYNVGSGNFKTSTLLYLINKGDTVGACNALRNWTYAGGKKFKGLVNRREIEREVCMWGTNP